MQVFFVLKQHIYQMIKELKVSSFMNKNDKNHENYKIWISNAVVCGGMLAVIKEAWRTRTL